MIDPNKHLITKEQKKLIILNYLEDVPMYKFACMAAMIGRQTLVDWQNEDEEFRKQCEDRMSRFVRRNLRKAKVEFQLERALRDDFSQRTELTGKDGKDLPAPILGAITKNGNGDEIHTDNSTK